MGVMAPPAAALAVLVGGRLTPGYDPVVRTISRLAAPGLPAAFAVEVAIGAAGAALVALALAFGPGSRGGRALLLVSGAGLLGAAAIRLDPTSTSATVGHRLATFVAMLALTGAPLAFASSLRRRSAWVGYARISFAVGAAEIGMLLVGLALLPSGFDDWGAWERSFLALPMAWTVLISARLLTLRTMDPRSSSTAESTRWATSASADDAISAAAATQSRGGS
jgi:hypothetical protein